MPRPRAPRDPDGPGEDRLIDALAQTTFLVTGSLTRLAADHELSLSQLRLLGILRDRTPRVAELAAALGLDTSSASGLIERAEARGLVRRERADHDRRVVEVRMTDAGHALADRIAADARAALAPLTRALTPAERRRLTATLVALLDAGRA